MKLSIIIVSWNTRELTLKCIKSLYRHLSGLNFEVFVVDNNSLDDTVPELEKFKSANSLNNLKILAEPINHGFARANNLALQKATGDYILLLNPDTEILCHPELVSARLPDGQGSHEKTEGHDKSGILQMINFAKSNSQIGIVGPQLLNSDYTLQRSCRHFPNFWDQFFIQLKFYNFFPKKISAIRKYFMLDFDHEQIKEVDQVMGAAMLIKKRVFNKIGLLDEKFWAIFEEVDFCYCAREAGWQTYFYPNTKIVHHKEQSFGQVNALRKQNNFNHSLYRYFKKHQPLWQLVILWLLQPLNLLLTWIDMKLKIRNQAGKSKDL